MKRARWLHVILAAAIVGTYVFAEWSGLAFGGEARPPLSPADLRQTSPGSWTYTYWSLDHHGK